MANAMGTLASALVIQRSLEMVFVRYPMLKALSLDLSDSQVDYNQSINSRYQTIATVNDFGTGATDRADTNVSVTINQFKEVHHSFTPQEYSGTKRNLIDESAAPITEAIGMHILGAVAGNTSPSTAGLWVNGTFTGSELVLAGANASTATITYAGLVSARTALTAAGVPKTGRFVALNGTAYGSVLNDSTIIEIQKNQNAGSAIQDGVLPGVAGFTIYEWPNLPLTGSSVTNARVGFCGVPQSTIFAGRVPKDPSSIIPGAAFPGNVGIVTDEGSGLSVMVNEWVDASTLKANVRLVFMYGVAAGHTGCGRVIRATAA